MLILQGIIWREKKIILFLSLFFFFFKNEAFVYSDEEIEWYLSYLKGRILISNEPHGANDQFKKSKTTLWALLQSLPTSFDNKRGIFWWYALRRGGQLCDIDLYANLRCNVIFLCSREMLDIHLFIFFNLCMNYFINSNVIMRYSWQYLPCYLHMLENHFSFGHSSKRRSNISHIGST